jgi:prepilin peptidase CpaA
MLSLAALAIYVLALLAGGLSDLVRYEIPNTVSLVLVAAFALFAPSLPLTVVGWHVACGVATLAATALFFAFRLIGGGDAKLLAATALWAGWQNLASFVLVTAIAGGILGLLLLTLRRFAPDSPPDRWYGRLLARGEGIPYGLAIAISGLALLPRLAPALLQ